MQMTIPNTFFHIAMAYAILRTTAWMSVRWIFLVLSIWWTPNRLGRCPLQPMSAFEGKADSAEPDLATSCLPVGPATMPCPVSWVSQCDGAISLRP